LIEASAAALRPARRRRVRLGCGPGPVVAEMLQRWGAAISAFALLCVAVWVVLLIALPQLAMFDFSLRPKLPPSRVGGPDDIYTAKNYLHLFASPLHRSVFLKTMLASVQITVVALVVCYPIAYFLAKAVRRDTAAVLLLSLAIPFWINEVLRTFAWFLILGHHGILNRALLGLGIVDAPVAFMSGGTGVLVGMVYAYVLLMVFPIYAAMNSLDDDQIEAARDLGAGVRQVHMRIVIPHAKAGIVAGCIMTFMSAAGSYVVPAILGGPSSLWFTQVIYGWFYGSSGGDWNRGAAYAFLLLVLCLAFIFLMMRMLRVRLRDVTA
jgi:spermidine/putrescine transport system permease protein